MFTFNSNVATIRADSSIRQLLILKKIPRYPAFITTKALASYLTDHGYGTTMRTVQRDIQSLSLIFEIIDTPAQGRGKEGVGWAFSAKAANQGLPSMDPSAALTMLMGYENLSALLPKQVLSHLKPYITEAESVLKSFNRKHFRSWIDKIRILPNTVLQPADIDEKAIHSIYDALLSNKKIVATYNGKKNQEITPYGVIQRANTLYLLCSFFNYEDIRSTALQRYSDVEVLSENIDKKIDFNIDDYINSGEMTWLWDDKAAQKNIKLKARIQSNLKFHLTESPLATDQKIKVSLADSEYILTASVLDSHELRYWLLSQGDSIEVLAPKPMRNWFCGIANNMANKYNDKPNNR